jgi:23S rRNA-/tRNA-specific pseudouridylate synthase
VLSRNDDGTSLLKVTPRTGRTNQIRLHLWHLGHPIVGDPAYLREGKTGSARTLTVDEPAMCLHARRIQLHDAQGAQREFCAPDPDWVDAEAVV